VKWEIQLFVYGQVISVCNSERIIKIGQYLRKLCSIEKGPVFLTHSVLPKSSTLYVACTIVTDRQQTTDGHKPNVT